MEAIFSSTLFTFFFFLVVGSVLVYFILKFDKQQRNKISNLKAETRDVQPLLMAKAINHKLKAIKPELNADSKRDIARQLDELVAAYDRGQLTLPDYCHKLNSLLSLVA